MVKNLPVMQETQVQSLGREDPLEEAWQPTPVFLPKKSHGQRSLLGYSLWGHKELDMTEATDIITFNCPLTGCFLPFGCQLSFLLQEASPDYQPIQRLPIPTPPLINTRAGFELRSLWLSDQGLPEFHLLGRLLKGGLLIRSFPARPGNLEPIFYV